MRCAVALGYGAGMGGLAAREVEADMIGIAAFLVFTAIVLVLVYVHSAI
jgi:hypothetical protein